MTESPIAGSEEAEAKQLKSIFVIMPFKKALHRSKQDLDSFFEHNLKARIERESSFAFRYQVSRSDNTLDITEKIVRDIFESDVVICDLSGHAPNPNVMYELGMRFALGHKPVILIREDDPKNQETFDIRGLYTHGYSSTRYKELEDHIIEKLKRFESGAEQYESPVLKVLSKQPQIIEALLKRQVRGIMRSIHQGFFACQELLRRRICRAIEEQFKNSKDSKPDAPKKSWEIVAFLGKHGSGLTPNFFRQLNFSPPPIPGLLGYLTYHPLAEIVPDQLAEIFGRELHGFYFHFFAGAHLQEDPSAPSYSFFAHQLGKLHDGAILLERFLAADSKSQRDALAADFVKLMNTWPQNSIPDQVSKNQELPITEMPRRESS